MYCVCIVIKPFKNCSQAILFLGEPQNLTQLGYHLSFGLKDLIYVKNTAHRALARLSPALARSKLQIDESVSGDRARAPFGPRSSAPLWQRSFAFLLVSSVLRYPCNPSTNFIAIFQGLILIIKRRGI